MPASGAQVSLDDLRVPEGFVVESAMTPGLVSYPMFLELDDAGRLYLAESTGKDISGKEMAAAPECLILRLTDSDGDGVYDSRTTFADTLSLPMGVLWHDEQLFVASPPDLIAFRDLDDDGVADERRVLLSGWNVLNTASLHGPFLGPDGWLYLTHGRHGYSIETQEGELLEGLAARIWRCRTDGSGLERYAGGGFDNPVEVVFTDSGDMIGTMTYFTDPRQGQRDALMHFVEGGVYPKPHPSVEEFVRTGPLMPVMTKFSRIAPSGLMRYRGTALGEDFRGDLFSAQFNPHRIQRHRLMRDGATWRTEDSDFLRTDNGDFYPTDIEEDADGSLLFCDTGAWYVDACPISRVAKPEVRGGIYRIRRDGAEVPGGSRGRGIYFGTEVPSALAGLLSDERIHVRDAAADRLRALGARAVPVLAEQLQAEGEGRFMVASLLRQDASEVSRAALRSGLADGDPEMRVACARYLGDLRDGASGETLVALLRDSDASVRRAAATALGRIGDGRFTGDLLDASGNAADRFEEHAIIFALIRSGTRDELDSGLDSESAGVRNAALWALDQREGEGLDVASLLPLLNDPETRVRNAAIEIASRHPEWSGSIRSYLVERLGTEGVPEAGLVSLLTAYSGDPEVQLALAGALRSPRPSPERFQTLLGVFRDAGGDWPATWSDAIGAVMQEGDEATLWPLLGVLRSRGTRVLDDSLRGLVSNSAVPAGLRFEALDVVVRSGDAIDDEDFGIVMGALLAPDDALLPSKAARMLARAELDPEQRMEIVQRGLSPANPLTFGTLLSALKNETREAVGLRLAAVLESTEDIDRLAPPGVLEGLFAGYPASVQERVRGLQERSAAESEERIGRMQALETRLGSGDVGRGRRIFFSEKAACSTCHAVGEEGGLLGPDLTTIGLVRSGHDILEAVLFPNASIVQGYENYYVETARGDFSGVLGDEDRDSITLLTGVDERVRIAREEIDSMSPAGVSMMPEGLETGMTPEELVDLVTFLQSLNNEQWLLPGGSDD